MRTPLTRKRFSNHLTYSGWKYLVLLCCSILCWNLIYTMTEPRPPEEKVVSLYAMGMGNQAGLDAYMENVRINEMP